MSQKKINGYVIFFGEEFFNAEDVELYFKVKNISSNSINFSAQNVNNKY
jgi:hypothetical protein